MKFHCDQFQKGVQSFVYFWLINAGARLLWIHAQSQVTHLSERGCEEGALLLFSMLSLFF